MTRVIGWDEQQPGMRCKWEFENGSSIEGVIGTITGTDDVRVMGYPSWHIAASAYPHITVLSEPEPPKPEWPEGQVAWIHSMSVGTVPGRTLCEWKDGRWVAFNIGSSVKIESDYITRITSVEPLQLVPAGLLAIKNPRPLVTAEAWREWADMQSRNGRLTSARLGEAMADAVAAQAEERK